jgi:Methyltransferase domain
MPLLTTGAWDEFPLELARLISSLPAKSTIIEIGGGANPALSKVQVKGHRYVIVDIDSGELSKSKGEYFETVCTDVTVDLKGLKCDFLFSKMLLEHVVNPKDFHIACHRLLNHDGLAFHFFATKYNPASVVNMVLPEHLSRRLLYMIQKRNWETEGKFPAYYRWAIGPTAHQHIRYASIGYEVICFNGYLGSSYLANVFILKHFEHLWNQTIKKLQSPLFCSSAMVTLKKVPITS